MKCRILFSGENKKNIIRVSSAELTQRVVKVKGPCKIVSDDINFFNFSKVFCRNIYPVLEVVISEAV